MAESSEALESTDVNATDSSTVGQDVAAESSTADEGVKAPASPLEAVKAALDASKDGDSAETTDTESTPRDADAKDTKVSSADSQNEGEDKSFSREANKRIRSLVNERNAVRAEVDGLKQAATAYEKVVETVRATGASAAQLDDAMRILTLFNSNPAKAFEMLTPIYQQLESFVGNRLPSDLQEKVDGGYIDEASAKELAKLRSQGQFTQQRHQQFVQQATQARQQEAVNGLKAAIGQASTDWEQNWKTNDPDYQRKMPFVMDAIKAQIQERGGIASPQEAVEIANAALKSVNDHLTGLMPKREVRTVTGGFQSGNATPKPRSPLEAARLALNR